MATRKVHAKYQEIIDLNTVDNTVSVIGIHTPTGDTPRRMFPGFFQQYRKWKYHGCSVTAVNPAQLPLDPLSIGYEAGEGNDAVMDQRDALNPVLFHGCHGEDLGAILNSLYANADTPSVYQYTDSVDGFNEDGTNPSDAGRSDMLEGLYYKSLTDCTWKKFNPQAGLRLRGLHPLVYQVASNHPMYPSSLGGNMELDGDNGVIPEIDGLFRTGSNNFHFITPKLQRLGWMDTRVPHVDPSVIAEFPDESLDYNDWMERMKAIENWAELEKLFMGVILLPPSYRFKQFYRFVITHYFSFAGFRGASLLPDPLGAPSMFHGAYNSIGEPIESQDQEIGGPSSGDRPVPITEVTTNLTWKATSNWSGTLTVVTKNTPSSTGLTETTTITLANSKTLWDTARVLPVGATITVSAAGAQGNVSCTAVTYEIQPDGSALALEFNMNSSQANSLGTTAVYS